MTPAEKRKIIAALHDSREIQMRVYQPLYKSKDTEKFVFETSDVKFLRYVRETFFVRPMSDADLHMTLWTMGNLPSDTEKKAFIAKHIAMSNMDRDEDPDSMDFLPFQNVEEWMY